MFKKKAKTNPTPVEAAEIFRRAIVDATDAPSALMSVCRL
jgi:hypothetical protein